MSALAPLLPVLREFLRREVRPLEIDAGHAIPSEVLRGLAELGLFGVTLPEVYGGAGCSASDAVQVVATLAERDRSVATTVGLHLGLGTRGLVAFGSRAQHERWLPRLASGQCIAAFATTEPQAGSDLSALASLATPTADGLSLSGTKLYVTNGGLCSLLTVTASTPGLGGAARGTSLLLVEPGARGVHRQPEERKLGLRGSSTTAFVFDDCALPADAVLGEPGRGARYLNHVLSWGRLLLSAGCVGTARAALTEALAWTHTRHQFRRALIAQEVVQGQLARAAAISQAMDALVAQTAAAEADEERLARLSLSTKIFCSEGAGQVADLALQLFGGSGYIEDTGLALMVRDARVTRIFEGANDVLQTHVGLQELLTPREAGAPPELARICEAVRARRDALCDDEHKPGVRALRRSAEHHALGRAVVWRDAAWAVTERARTEPEQAAASLMRELALEVAHTSNVLSVPPALTATLLSGVLP